MIDKIVQFFKWIASLFKRFLNWIKGTKKEMTDSIEIKRMEKDILWFMGDSIRLDLNKTIQCSIYNWRDLSNLFGGYDIYKDRWTKYVEIYKKKKDEAKKAENETIERLKEDLRKATNGEKGLQYIHDLWVNRYKDDSRPEYEKYEKLFGKEKMKIMAMSRYSGALGMGIQDSISIYAEAFESLFNILEIDIDEVELDNFSVKDIDKKFYLLFFDTESPKVEKREISLREFASQSNLQFLKKYHDWKKELIEEEKKTSYYIEEHIRYMTHKENKVKEFKNALEKFISQVEKWDGKEAIMADNMMDHDILNTNRYKIWNSLTVKDKEKIISSAIAEVRALNVITGFEIIDHQIYIEYNKSIYKIATMLEKDVMHLIHAIRYNEDLEDSKPEIL